MTIDVQRRRVAAFAIAVVLPSLGCRRADPSAGPTAAVVVPIASASAAPAARAPIADDATPPDDLPELPAGSGPPVVGLDGASRPWPPPLPDGVARVAALAIETPVLAKPDVYAARLGQLRAGAIVEVDPTPVAGNGCSAGFRAIRPLGYVCLGSATLDRANPIVRASTRRPDVTQTLPYIYGTAVRGGPAYGALPTAEDLATTEPHLAGHLRRWARDRVSGAPYGLELWGKWKSGPLPPALDALGERRTDPDLPWFVRDGAHVPNLSGLVSPGRVRAGEFSRHNGMAFLDSFLWEGRRYNVTVDLRLMPADRFRPIKGSELHGFRIPEDVKLPFVIVRSKRARRRVERNGNLGGGERLEWRSALEITGKKRVANGRTFDELADGGWVAEDEVSLVEIAHKMPGWANDGEKWLDVDVLRQTLVAYEGTRPVYATIVSTGEAGLGDPKTTRSTARGVFRIHTKYLTATMDSKVVGEEFELRDVPYVQYFHEGYALHAAYWHDAFGKPKSHGCINLSPEDARRIFFWTEPRVPDGWHGASKGRTGTVVYIHH